jgi:hypothetical protein
MIVVVIVRHRSSLDPRRRVDDPDVREAPLDPFHERFLEGDADREVHARRRQLRQLSGRRLKRVRGLARSHHDVNLHMGPADPLDQERLWKDADKTGQRLSGPSSLAPGRQKRQKGDREAGGQAATENSECSNESQSFHSQLGCNGSKVR